MEKLKKEEEKKEAARLVNCLFKPWYIRLKNRSLVFVFDLQVILKWFFMLIIFQAQVELAKLKTEAMLAGKSIKVSYFTMFKDLNTQNGVILCWFYYFEWHILHYDPKRLLFCLG